MAIVQSGQASEGIKLFGTTIMLYDKERKEEKNESSEKRPDKIIACPRCKSMETKFCYFNNYNVNQPRHFCKGCQRYWTAGGALRNVPVGAGRRKTKLSIHDSIEFLNVEVQQQFSLEKRLVLDDDFHPLILSSKKPRMNSTPHGQFC